MPTPPAHGSVQLADNQSASLLLHTVLHEAVAAFPDALAPANLPPSPNQFRKTYPDALCRFEAARVASGQRTQIASLLAAASQQRVVWADGDTAVPLATALQHPAPPLDLDTRQLPGSPGWHPEMHYHGRHWAAEDLQAMVTDMLSRHTVTTAAADAMAWVLDNVMANNTINLASRKVVVLGAGAEMAATRCWLAAGADLLWLDVAPPPEDLLNDPALAGRLTWPLDNVDLLQRPHEVLATIKAFADGAPVDIGLYAYAPGQAREYRLAATMGALVNALPRDIIASVTLLVSPTTPVALESDTVNAARQRLQQRPRWEASMAAMRLLGSPNGQCQVGDVAATRSVVAIQGASYQAAQYLEKMMAAEAWASGDAPLRVSANVAAITQTKSLQHPMFNAAFFGAGAFGVETFTPELSRNLNGLLALRDWFAPEPAAPGTVRVHGGIHTLPYPLADALTVAAIFGFIRAPRLLSGFWRR